MSFPLDILLLAVTCTFFYFWFAILNLKYLQQVHVPMCIHIDLIVNACFSSYLRSTCMYMYMYVHTYTCAGVLCVWPFVCILVVACVFRNVEISMNNNFLRQMTRWMDKCMYMHYAACMLYMYMYAVHIHVECMFW